MITSKNDYHYFLRADVISMSRSGRPMPFCDDLWRFVRLLRKVEYYVNCKPSLIYYLYRIFLKYKFGKKSIQMGMTIPLKVCDAGLSIAHYGTIVINGGIKLEKIAESTHV